MSEAKKGSTLKELLGFIEGLSPEHVVELDEEIGKVQEQLERLERVRKLIVGKQPRSPRQPRTTKPGGERRVAIAKLLLAERAMHAQVICNRLNLPVQGFASTMNHDWFELSASGYKLTPAGRAAAMAA